MLSPPATSLLLPLLLDRRSVYNCCRCCRCPQVPGATTYFGCVGDDHYAAELKKVASKDGVKVRARQRLIAPAGAFCCS